MTLQTEKEARERQNRFLNPNVDREMAVPGQRDDSKLKISIKLAVGRAEAEYSHGVEWTSGALVGALNKWRAQFLRYAHPAFLLPYRLSQADTFNSRYLGAVREGRVPFSAEERQWMIEHHLQYQHEQFATAPDRAVNWRGMSWNTIEREFNAEFEGRVIDGVARPYRTGPSLRTDRSRIPELVTLTGTSIKKPRASQTPGPREVESEERDDDDDRPKKNGKQGAKEG